MSIFERDTVLTKIMIYEIRMPAHCLEYKKRQPAKSTWFFLGSPIKPSNYQNNSWTLIEKRVRAHLSSWVEITKCIDFKTVIFPMEQNYQGHNATNFTNATLRLAFQWIQNFTWSSLLITFLLWTIFNSPWSTFIAVTSFKKKISSCMTNHLCI